VIDKSQIFDQLIFGINFKYWALKVLKYVI